VTKRSPATRPIPEPPPAPEPLNVPVLDSHTHLDLQETDVAAALAAAAAVGVTRVVQVGIDVPSSRWGTEIAAEFDPVLATVALHPNEAPRLSDLAAALADIDELAASPQVRGIGETGLDYFRTEPDGRAAQERSFRAHIEIAKRHGKALVIHDRDAHDDVLRVLAEEGAPERVVFHCFSGGPELAKACAEHGYVMSFAGTVTFKTAEPLREAARIAPRDLILVETDGPFLTPMPYRGRPNAPYLIPITVRALAEVRGDDLDELCAAIWANGERTFGP
jgi:TatD DNase family protein